MTRALGLALLALAPLAGPKKKPEGPYVVPPGEGAGLPVARLSYVEGGVERAPFGRAFKDVPEGSELRTGDRIRTGPAGVARIEFPLMSLTVAPASVVSIPPGIVLSLVLEQGRGELRSEGDIIKLRTDEARIRGGGRLVVRRGSGGPTAVAALDGRFVVTGGDRDVTLEAGHGTVIGGKSLPTTPRPLAVAPSALVPGADALYARPRQPARLAWTSARPAHHIQVLGIDSEDVLLEKDVGPSPATVEIPWLGTFRWRVSVRGPDGLEGMPSPEGVVCVVEE
jgi:hypothetical protein